MRIAQVAPLFEAVPPKFYGGTERIISYLTEELVRQGHNVTLFASGDSETRAKLISPCEEAIRLSQKNRDPLIYHYMMFDQVLKMQEEFDIIHFHNDYHHFILTYALRVPSVTTLHGRLDLIDYQDIFRTFKTIPIVSISHAQRKPIPLANWVGTVYHGLPVDLLSYQEKKENYVAFLGRISPEKNPLAAIEIAKKAGIKIKIAAKIDNKDKEYYESEVKDLMSNDPNVEYIGEIAEHQKSEFLGKAKALLFPIDWPEPFGLVMIEAMACGTPIIAYRNGSVPEIIDPGESGFIISSNNGNSIEQAVHALENVDLISPQRCRKTFEKRFLVERMAKDYLDLYRKMSKGNLAICL